MHTYSYWWFIVIIISTKCCVTYQILQRGDTSLVTSFFVNPIKNIYETSKAVPSLFQKVTHYIASPTTIFRSNLGQYTQLPQLFVPQPPDPLNVPSTTIPTVHSGNYFTAKQKTFQTLTPVSDANKLVTRRAFVTNWGARKNDAVQLTTPDLNSTNDVEYYGTQRGVTSPTTSTYGFSAPYMFEEISASNIDAPFNDFTQVVERLEHKFYDATFRKFLSISHPERQENGITFAQSGLFLYLQLMTLCTESEVEVTTQIMQSLGLKTTCEEQVQVLNRVMAILPRSSTFLKFRWSSRLVLAPQLNVSEKFLGNTAPALQVVLDLINNTDNPEELTNRLNLMVAKDSGGAMHSTFEEEELSNGICAVWLTTLYMRARWRSAPTVLNGSRPFYDGNAPPRTVRMIRINDQMKYASLDERDAEAIEIRYAIPDLTLLLLVPRGRSLKNLANWVSKNNLQSIYKKMQEKRVAVSLPIYTLRMTLLLPGKLETMGMSSLVQAITDNNCNSLKLSHAVQRIMFWAEAGRNAYKDDGIEWDEKPELEIVVNRPYIFFVRWRNLTLLSGNFVL